MFAKETNFDTDDDRRHRRLAVALESADADRDCGCTGTAITTRWTSATRAPRSARARPRTRSISRRSIGLPSGFSISSRPRFRRSASTGHWPDAGKPIYQQQCASCHDVGQPRVGQVIDIAEIGTHRAVRGEGEGGLRREVRAARLQERAERRAGADHRAGAGRLAALRRPPRAEDRTTRWSPGRSATPPIEAVGRDGNGADQGEVPLPRPDPGRPARQATARRRAAPPASSW